MKTKKQNQPKETKLTLKEYAKNTFRFRQLVVMGLPAFLFFALFSYVPMYGVILAFKRYNFTDGILGALGQVLKILNFSTNPVR